MPVVDELLSIKEEQSEWEQSQAIHSHDQVGDQEEEELKEDDYQEHDALIET